MFDKIIGNEQNKNLLIKSVKKNNILHSYLFYGTEGIGKKMFAIEFAKMILCNGTDDTIPCDKCKSCIEFNSGNNPDYFIIEPEGSTIKIDQIRNMQKSILEKPIESTKKVYVINNADTMTKEAQNCMLKTLEEPQEFVVIILIASNENNILPTVKSRCTKIYFKELESEELNNYIKNNYSSITIDDNILKLCNGSIAKAQFIIEKIDTLNKIKNIVLQVEKENKLNFIQNNQLLYENKEDITTILEYINMLLFERAKKSTEKIDGYLNSIEIVEQTKRKLSNSNNFDMTIDNMLIKIWEEINEKNYRC